MEKTTPFVGKQNVKLLVILVFKQLFDIFTQKVILIIFNWKIGPQTKYIPKVVIQNCLLVSFLQAISLRNTYRNGVHKITLKCFPQPSVSRFYQAIFKNTHNVSVKINGKVCYTKLTIYNNKKYHTFPTRVDNKISICAKIMRKKNHIDE